MMVTTKVLLLRHVEKLGGEGDAVSVKAGYARNFLLPKKLATPMNRSNRKQIESLRRARQIRETKELTDAERMADRLRQLTLTVAVKTGGHGKLFGSVTAADLHERLGTEGFDLERHQIRLFEPIKTLGRHTFKVKLHRDIVCDMTVEVVSENPIEA
jgi:large subunit ribosomal protein L9